MSKDWFADIAAMHDYYGMTGKHAVLSDEYLSTLFDFRLDFITEELDETSAAREEGNADGIVDGLIDIIVVAIGTLHAFGVDGHEAWDRVLKANMAKVPGIKPERPNPLGLPDLIKPEGWTAPTHADNVGNFSKLKPTLDDYVELGPCDL